MSESAAADPTPDDLLQDAENALRSFSLSAIAVSPLLQTPYSDAPEHSPWSLMIGREARRAHEISLAIRKYFGGPRRMAIRAVSPSALTPATALRQQVADLHMADIKTGEQYERLVSEVISDVYAPPDRL